MSYYDNLERKINELREQTEKIFERQLKLADMQHNASYQKEYNKLYSEFLEAKLELQEQMLKYRNLLFEVDIELDKTKNELQSLQLDEKMLMDTINYNRDIVNGSIDYFGNSDFFEAIAIELGLISSEAMRGSSKNYGNLRARAVELKRRVDNYYIQLPQDLQLQLPDQSIKNKFQG